jgi:hypothetical protein
MPHENGNTVGRDERAVAIHVARWLIVALPQELADALDTYVGSLESEATDSAAARRLLQMVLLECTLPRMPAVTPTTDQPSHPVSSGET